jgi:hypothetical protein
MPKIISSRKVYGCTQLQISFKATSTAAIASKREEELAMRTQKPSVKLEDWAVVLNANPGSYQQLRPGNLLVGRAFGHQRIEPGMFVFTSPIVRVDAEHRIAETRNTAYHLGEASREYKAWTQTQSAAA